jgi:hypothetical protein
LPSAAAGALSSYRDAGISGGNGSDTADYFQSTAGLTVGLATPVNNAGEAIGIRTRRAYLFEPAAVSATAGHARLARRLRPPYDSG